MRKILETKLNGGNIITGVTKWEISSLRYFAAFLDLTGEIDKRTRKLMTMHQTLNGKVMKPGYTYLEKKEGED